MLTRILSPLLRLPSLAVMTGIFLLPAQSRAQTPDQGTQPVAVAAAPTPVCALLQKQLRWHEPFFGLRTWTEVADEAVAHATGACRAAIAAGKAPEVALALHDLATHQTADELQLGWFRDRLVCQLRVPEARPQILAGVLVPAVYAECADALFALEWSDPAALQLRERYLEGLRQEPLKTHLVRSILQPSYAGRLAPVLLAYEKAQRPGRDALYRTVCDPAVPTSAELRAACAGPSEREPEWIANKILGRDVEAGMDSLAVLAPDQLPKFAWLLHKFDAEQRPGRDRIYGLLCLRHPSQTPELGATCGKLFPRQEARWAALSHAQYLEDERALYNRVGFVIAGGFLGLSLLLTAQRRLGRQRWMPNPNRAR